MLRPPRGAPTSEGSTEDRTTRTLSLCRDPCRDPVVELEVSEAALMRREADAMADATLLQNLT